MTPQAIEEATGTLRTYLGHLGTGPLCQILASLETGRRQLTSEEQLLRGLLLETLTERHPEADQALDRWATCMVTDQPTVGSVTVVIAAALAAAGGSRG